jgi:hypothetical protein
MRTGAVTGAENQNRPGSGLRTEYAATQNRNGRHLSIVEDVTVCLDGRRSAEGKMQIARFSKIFARGQR